MTTLLCADLVIIPVFVLVKFHILSCWICFLQLQKSLLQHLMKFHFDLLNLMYITTIYPPEINSANRMLCNKLSYFHFNVSSLAKNKHKIDTFFSMSNVSPDYISISKTKLKSKCFTNIQIPN